MKMYALYAVILFFFVFLILMLDYFLQTRAQQSYQILPVMIYNFTVYPLVGSIVGFIGIAEKRNIEGRWRINGGKLFFIALPAFFFAYYPYLVYFSGPLQFLQIPISYVNHALVDIQVASFVFQFIMGYFLVASVDREEAGDAEQPLSSY